MYREYGLAISLKLEKFLAQMIAEGVGDWGEVNDCLEGEEMRMVAKEVLEESGNRSKSWCSDGKSFRVGEIDWDTIVPEDCFRDVAREMYETPDVAIIQHESEVVQVAHHYFEIVTWNAVQKAAFIDPADGKRKM
ncbi:hypothetical protein H0H93_009318 [Arthromyces matolae]|nr:hypothetical protein H0H93_009318 [Arthromyces matolae]